MNERFEIVSTQTIGANTLFKIEVLKDKETGVLYLCRLTPHGSGLTLLVDRDGRPLLA